MGTSIRLLGLSAVLCLFAANLSAQPVEQQERSLDVQGVEREYLLLVPERSAGEPRPLVFNFHGSGGSPNGQLATSDFARVAGEHGFLAVLPQGVYMNTRSSRSWNADLDPAGVDDVALVRAIIDDVRRTHNVDTARIYSTGFSGGARMTSRLGCELSDVLAAVAPVGGIQFGAGCDPDRALPLLTFHGKADGVNHFVPNGNSAAYWVDGVDVSIARWVAADRCSATPEAERLKPTVEHKRWAPCSGDAVVEVYLIEDGGHTWPGSERDAATTHGLDASELIWRFFSRYRLTPP